MIELKPCPNCGDEPRLHKTSRGKFRYECSGDCWLHTSNYWQESDAANEWNSFVERVSWDEDDSRAWDELIERLMSGRAAHG